MNQSPSEEVFLFCLDSMLHASRDASSANALCPAGCRGEQACLYTIAGGRVFLALDSAMAPPVGQMRVLVKKTQVDVLGGLPAFQELLEAKLARRQHSKDICDYSVRILPATPDRLAGLLVDASSDAHGYPSNTAAQIEVLADDATLESHAATQTFNVDCLYMCPLTKRSADLGSGTRCEVSSVMDVALRVSGTGLLQHRPAEMLRALFLSQTLHIQINSGLAAWMKDNAHQLLSPTSDAARLEVVEQYRSIASLGSWLAAFEVIVDLKLFPREPRGHYRSEMAKFKLGRLHKLVSEGGQTGTVYATWSPEDELQFRDQPHVYRLLGLAFCIIGHFGKHPEYLPYFKDLVAVLVGKPLAKQVRECTLLQIADDYLERLCKVILDWPLNMLFSQCLPTNFQPELVDGHDDFELVVDPLDDSVLTKNMLHMDASFVSEMSHLGLSKNPSLINKSGYSQMLPLA